MVGGVSPTFSALAFPRRLGASAFQTDFLSKLLSSFRYCPLCGQALSDLELAGRQRRACADSACGFVHWDNPLPVVAALVEWEGRMVLARNVAWAEGKFGLITGFLERDESPTDAVAREVKEELDLDACAVSLIGVYAFPVKNELIVAYHVVAAGHIQLNEELAEIRLVEPGRLKAWDYGTGHAVRDWLARRRNGVAVPVFGDRGSPLVRK